MTFPYGKARSTIKRQLALRAECPKIAKSHGTERSARGLTPLGAAA
jgi:hypothetical protein